MQVQINASPAVTRWSVSSGLTIVSSNTSRIIVRANNTGNYSVVGIRSNSCGDANRTASITVRSNSSPPPSGCAPNCPVNPIVVYSNPVDDVLTIELEEAAFNSSGELTVSIDNSTAESTTHTLSKYPPLSVKLFDSRQQVIRQVESKAGKIQLDVRQLPPGVYILHVYNQKTVVQEQIIVQ